MFFSCEVPGTSRNLRPFLLENKPPRKNIPGCHFYFVLELLHPPSPLTKKKSVIASNQIKGHVPSFN